MARKHTQVNQTTTKPDNSPQVHQKSVMKSPVELRELKWTDKQRQFFNIAFDKHTQMIIVKGVAGTSKSSVAIFAALKLLNEKKISDILYIRSVVESADNKMGYLPGLLEDKLQPYLMPLFDKLDMFVSKNDIQRLQAEERVAASPVSFLRGADWQRKGVIIDETQNFSRKELLTLTTRIGQFCKVFVAGDEQQSDIKNSGFAEVYNLFDNEESREKGIFCFEFTEEDVMRSELCRYVAKKFKELPDKAFDAHKKHETHDAPPTKRTEVEEWRPKSN